MGTRWTMAVAAALAVVGGATPAAAAEDVGGYADWSMTGSGNAYQGTMTLPGEFPAANFESDARAVSQINSGASTWLPEGTPFGEVFGDSRDQSYPTLRPYADRAGAPSTTTFTFDSATPAKDWGFALGDIDADMVTVSATDAAGNPVPLDGLGFQGVFNYCDTSPKSGACSGATEYRTPTWIPGVTSGQLVGDGVDRAGGSGWFRPTAAIKTLTFTFERLTGFPIYQVWFARLPKPDEPTEPPTDGPSDSPSDGPSDGPSSTAAPAPGPGTDGGADNVAGGGTGGGPTLPVTGTKPLLAVGLSLGLLGGGFGIVWALRRRAATR